MTEAREKILHGSSAKQYLAIYGGIAAVPMVVLAGYAWGNQQKIFVRDYDRSSGYWHNNAEPDDGVPVHSTPLPTSTGSGTEVGLCLEFSIRMDWADMNKRFSGVPLFVMNFADGKFGIDRLSSEHKQQRYIREVVNYLNSLIKCFPNIEVLHLFITAQSSFVFRVGQALHQNHMPTVRIHHYDGKEPLGQRHTWSLEIRDSEDYRIL